jgi:hypothetical protein
MTLIVGFHIINVTAILLNYEAAVEKVAGPAGETCLTRCKRKVGVFFLFFFYFF